MRCIHGLSYYQHVRPARFFLQVHVAAQRLHEVALQIKHGSQEIGELHMHLRGRFPNSHPVDFYPGKKILIKIKIM